jgi:hypothetical protein
MYTYSKETMYFYLFYLVPPSDQCTPNTCLNGGQCVLEKYLASCVCPEDYIMSDCGEHIDNIHTVIEDLSNFILI